MFHSNATKSQQQISSLLFWLSMFVDIVIIAHMNLFAKQSGHTWVEITWRRCLLLPNNIQHIQYIQPAKEQYNNVVA